MKPEGPKHRLSGNMSPRARGPFATLIALIIGAVLLALGFMFALLLLAGVVAVGLAVYAYLWWKTRALRKHFRERMRSQSDRGAKEEDSGAVIEGVVVVHEGQGKSEKGESK